MSDPIWIISVAAFLGAGALGAAIFMMVRDAQAKKAEERLEVLAGVKMPGGAAGDAPGIMKEDLAQLSAGAMQSLFGGITARLQGLSLFFEQANSPIKFETFLLISGALGLLGAVAGLLINAPTPLLPVFGLATSLLPLCWLWFRRRSRFSKFEHQLVDALELLARALRSGHSLNSALQMISTEMPDPIASEFRNAFEEQNLGVPVEQALKNMLKRMPNLDLKFFVTAVAIQRQTGGDLAEILDKIGYVIRERFKILGTVKALTGEGRLSGAVLMALPIVVFIAVYYLNPEYVMLLFTTSLGKKMVAVGIIMQVLGAITIQKIIDIKV